MERAETRECGRLRRPARHVVDARAVTADVPLMRESAAPRNPTASCQPCTAFAGVRVDIDACTAKLRTTPISGYATLGTAVSFGRRTSGCVAH